MALTTDFTGTYDYEREEASHAVNYLRELLDDGESLDYVIEYKDKDLSYWKNILESESYAEFVTHYNNEFNRLIKQSSLITEYLT
jgi:hypothetical protein